MTRILPFAAVLFVLSCSSGPGPGNKHTDPTTDTGADTDTDTDTETNGFQLTGQEGSLIVVNAARSVVASGSYTVSAMFADTLQGILTPNWCFIGGACLTSLPAVGANEPFSTGIFEPDASTYNWVGNEIFVGTVKLPFINDFQRGLAYYSVALPQTPDGNQVVVQIAGEWGNHQTDDFEIPPAVTITSPDPLVELGLGGVIPFRWTPPAEGQIYVRFEGGGTDRIFQLDNTGTFDLDTATLGVFDPAQVRVFFGVWSERTIDVNGNQLQAFGVWEQRYQGVECAPYPDGPLLGNGGTPAGPDMNPAWVTMGFDGVIDNDRFYDYYNDSDGDMVPEVFSASVWFDFYEDDAANPGQAGAHLCQVTYDASATMAANYVSQSGVIYNAFDVALADGDSDCNSLDAAIWNSIDVRDVLESPLYSWGFGVGEVVDTLAELEAKYDPDWAVWQPLVAGGYVSSDGVLAFEYNEVHAYPLSECATVMPAKTEVDVPIAGPVFAANYSAIPLTALPFAPPP